MLPDRLDKHIDMTEEGQGCWTWTGRTSKNGYGRILVDGREVAAHRLVYQVFIGSVGKRTKLDHKCCNPACVNPSHMEPVSNKRNTLKGTGPTAVNARKTHCKRGHPLSGRNLATRKTTRKGKPVQFRACRACAAHARGVKQSKGEV